MHRLPPAYREWLSAAAMLYEVGNYVNRSGRHRHTHYIISNSEILGYTPEERRVIAGIARYLGSSRPAPADPQGGQSFQRKSLAGCLRLVCSSLRRTAGL